MAQIIPIRPQAAQPADAPQARGTGAASGRLADVENALTKVAKLIAAGEDWALPLFLRLESELEALQTRETALNRARRRANTIART